ncbi:MAG: hypothetical protein EOP08_05135 [Proteobacteria bacterium]|nr:MAG: hypothetical protein EOP08_05135 [Pseudomonadota bacterium]
MVDAPAGRRGDRVKERTLGQRVRPLLRSLHRDAGYLAVGLTVIYAVSGLSVNHVAEYTGGDASFVKIEASHELGPLGAASDPAVVALLRDRLGAVGEAGEPFRRSDTEVEVTFVAKGALGGSTERHFVVETSTGHVDEDGKKPRFFVRFANWLHLNRGKRAWSYIADAYAIGLLFLAISGLFMIPGKKGLLFRGLLIAGIGAAIPVLYVVFA